MKQKMTAKVLSQKEIAPGIFDMWIATGLAKEASAGQFIGVYPKDKSTLLPRPISICEVEKEENKLRIVYRVAGKGTGEFSAYQAGDEVEILGILGNGFPLVEAQNLKVVLMGGGIGIPPMVELAKELRDADVSVIAIAGYRDNRLFLREDLEKYAEVYVATEDGSEGVKGNVLTVMEEKNIQADIIMACGPMPMLRGIKKYSEEKGIKAYISLEE